MPTIALHQSESFENFHARKANTLALVVEGCQAICVTFVCCKIFAFSYRWVQRGSGVYVQVAKKANKLVKLVCNCQLLLYLLLTKYFLQGIRCSPKEMGADLHKMHKVILQSSSDSIQSSGLCHALSILVIAWLVCHHSTSSLPFQGLSKFNVNKTSHPLWVWKHWILLPLFLW